MRAVEFVNEDMSRRGFLGAMGAAAATAATGANAGVFMDPKTFGFDKWMDESKKLQARLNNIRQKLVIASGKDAQLLKAVRVGTTVTQSGGEAYGDGEVNLDVSTFYDLSDDAIAYVIGHEMGHVALRHNGYKGVAPQQARQNELAADVYGAKLAFAAGYDPKQAFASFDAALKRGETDAYHPTYQTRKAHVRQQTGIPVATINDLQHNMMAIRNFMSA